MATSLFRFGAFRLDPQARELFRDGRRVELPLSTIDCLIHLIRHRDRPVGRDELASAVWGRVDVSEVSLSHAIMRLRRTLGDDGNAQRCIRTVPRLGYRWVLALDADVDADVVEADDPPPPPVAARPGHEADAPAASPPGANDEPSSTARAPRSRLHRPVTALLAVALAALVAVVAVVAVVARKPSGPPPAPAGTEAAAESALVLPVAVEAGEDAVWMRLGLMDLVATQLRRGGLPTMPSETVVALLGGRDGGPRDLAGRPATWTIRLRARLDGGRWAVALDAENGERTLELRAQAADALVAARAAADELLIRLGRTPPRDEGGDAALAAATLRQRVNAALLSGQIAIAQRIVEQAPAVLQADPEIGLAHARVALASGAYADAQQRARDLAGRLPPDAAPDLRARVLNGFAAAAMRQGHFDEAEPAYAEAARLLDGRHDPVELATAWRGLANVASERGRLERAAADYGRARTLYELGNDPFGLAAVDLNLAILAMQRGQPSAALGMLQDVRARLRHFAAAEALAATEIVLVEAQLDLLEPEAALATSEAFDSPAAAAGNARLRWQLLFARAAALHGAGRLAEADAVLARLRDGSDAQADALARALGDSLAARIALEREDFAHAIESAEAAMTPAFAARNPEQYARAALVRIRALQRRGDLAAAAEAIGRLKAQAGATREGTTRIPALLSLAEAEQASAAGESADALRHYAAAMQAATAQAIPEDMVRIGLPYVRELLAAGRLDEAASVNGRIAPWAERDVRAAWSQALLYSALGQDGPAAAALERARRLAGERRVSDVVASRR